MISSPNLRWQPQVCQNNSSNPGFDQGRIMRRMAAWLLLGVTELAVAQEPYGVVALSADQIADKNAAARGGLEAWRKIQTMVWSGHVESAQTPARFVLAQKRPDRTRFEMVAAKQMSLRVFDGSHGWKLHAASTGSAPQLLPYSQEELQFSHDEPIIDGPLLDYRVKGVSIALGGVEPLGGRPCYRLALRLPSGAARQLWIDAQSFLDVRYDREARNPQGQPVTLSVRYGNYQPVEGLLIPRTIEASAAMGNSQVDRLVIDKIELNPPLDDWVFVKPGMRRSRAAAPAAPAWRSAGSLPAPARVP